jgi:hypothetical protein
MHDVDPPFVSFQRQVWWLMVLCPDNMAPCPNVTLSNFVDAKKVASRCYLHLLQALFSTPVAIEHRPDIPIWSGIVAGAAQAQY